MIIRDYLLGFSNLGLVMLVQILLHYYIRGCGGWFFLIVIGIIVLAMIMLMIIFLINKDYIRGFFMFSALSLLVSASHTTVAP